MAVPVITTLVKHAGESRLYAWDFANQPELVSGGLTVASAVSVTASPATTPALTVGPPFVSGTQVRAVLSGGAACTDYQVTALALLSDGTTVLESVGTLIVDV